MASVENINHFNNLRFNTQKRAIANYFEHRAGRVPLDLSYKHPSRISEVLSCKTSQINGKSGDLKYKPKNLHSRSYYGYDSKFDPTILNAVRNTYVDVSGLLIPNRNLPKINKNMNATVRPLIPYGVIY